MQIDACAMEGDRLCLTLERVDDGRRFAEHFKPGEYSIDRQKKRRSLDANAYAWVLIDRIARAAREPPITVYRRAVADMGGVSTIVCVERRAVDDLERTWVRGHLGRLTERMPSKVRGCINVRLTYGSSDYSKEEMARFIDILIQDAKALGVETLGERELSLLLEEWR